jgi:hypothetical protein
MNSSTILKYITISIGLIVTLFMLVAFGPKFIGMIQDEGVSYLSTIPNSFTDWYDDPTAFFLTYFIGYTVIWWRPVMGSAIIILGDILFFAFNSQNMGTFIFIIPTITVAILYLIHWDNNKKVGNG